jgi:hypothetical protein
LKPWRERSRTYRTAFSLRRTVFLCRRHALRSTKRHPAVAAATPPPRPRIGFDLVQRSPLNSAQSPPKANRYRGKPEMCEGDLPRGPGQLSGCSNCSSEKGPDCNESMTAATVIAPGLLKSSPRPGQGQHRQSK